MNRRDLSEEPTEAFRRWWVDDEPESAVGDGVSFMRGVLWGCGLSLVLGLCGLGVAAALAAAPR